MRRRSGHVPAAGTAQPIARGSPTAGLPAWIPPQLTQLVDTAPDGDQWFHEIKYDGYRMHARLDRGAVKLLTRTGGPRQRGGARFFPVRSSLPRRRGFTPAAADRAQGTTRHAAREYCTVAALLQRSCHRAGPGFLRQSLRDACRGHRLETHRCGLYARQSQAMAQGQMPQPRRICCRRLAGVCWAGDGGYGAWRPSSLIR